jgi:putative FmdB family regulatory protein
MPLYEYECDACGHRCELIQKYSDPPPAPCAKCGKGPLQRLQSSPAIQFKGSGWYITDYARKGASSGAEGSTKEGGGGEAPATTEASGESKKDAAKETKKSDAQAASTSTSDTAPKT